MQVYTVLAVVTMIWAYLSLRTEKCTVLKHPIIDI